MKTLLLIFTFTIFTINSLFAQSGWFTVYGDTNYAGHSNFFTDVNTGYESGAKYIGQVPFPRILKTTNAGANWFEQMTPQRDSVNFVFRNVFFINSNTGFVTAAYSSNPFIGRVLKTTNAGNSWSICPLPVDIHMTFVYFVNSSTGYASGYQTILKTTDTGVTWVAQNPNVSLYLFAIHFIDINSGYVAGNGGTILKTTNGGSNWALLNTGTTQPLWGLHFINANTGLAVGGPANNSLNIIIRTTDAGLTWNQIQYTGSTCLLWSVRFISPTTGWIIGWCNQILKTVDGGLTWHNQVSPATNGLLRTCYFTSALTGYVTGEALNFGDNGYILKTTDGGGNFVGINPVTNELPSQFRLYNNYPNPFNPDTKIRFDLPSNLSYSGGLNGIDALNVRLQIYDASGKEIEILVDKLLRPGSYEVEWNAANYSSGIYFYRITVYSDKLSAGDFLDTKKMILLK